MTTDFRALCAELVDDLELLISYGSTWKIKDSHDLRDRARAALAAEAEGEELRFDGGYESGSMWTGHPLRPAALAAEPEPPADGEVAELVAWLRQEAQQHADSWPEASAKATRLADVVERLAPQPVPEGPTDEEILEWANSSDSPVPQEFVSPDVCGRKHYSASEQFCWTVRAVLARWGRA